MLQKTREGRGILWILVVLCGLHGGPVFAQNSEAVSVAANADTQDLLFTAEDLLGNGRSDRAYDLLILEEARLAGNPLLDYLLGVITGCSRDAVCRRSGQPGR